MFISLSPTVEEQDKREKQINTQLDENATLLVSLAMEQKERLSRPLPPTLNSMPQPTTQELKLGGYILHP